MATHNPDTIFGSSLRQSRFPLLTELVLYLFQIWNLCCPRVQQPLLPGGSSFTVL